MECKYCGNTLEESETFCKKCGHKVEPNEKVIVVKEKVPIRDEVKIEEPKEEKIVESVKTEPEVKPEKKVKTNGEKSLICGVVSIIVGIVLNVLTLIPGVMGIVYARKNKKETGKYGKGLGLSILGIIIGLVVCGLLVWFFILKADKKEIDVKPEEKTDYNEVLQAYGKQAETVVSEYLKTNNVMPSWEQISSMVVYQKYKVACEETNINSTGTVYLNNCSIDAEKVQFSYGEKEEIVIEKNATYYIYYATNDDYSYYIYNNKSMKEMQQDEFYGDMALKLITTYKTSSDDCKINFYNSIFIVTENEEVYYLDAKTDRSFKKINYSNSYELVYGKYNVFIDVYYYNSDVIGYYSSYDNEFYIDFGYGMNLTFDSVTYISFDASTLKDKYMLVSKTDKSDKENAIIYNFVTKKEVLDVTTSDFYWYRFYNNNGYYTVEDGIDTIEYRLFDKNFKEVLGDKTVLSSETSYVSANGDILFINNYYDYEAEEKVYADVFNIYNKNSEVIFTSKKYAKVFMVASEYIVVEDTEGYLKLIDYYDKEVVSFAEWKESYYLHTMLSGDYESEGKQGIYLIVEDASLGYDQDGMAKGYEYYYIYKTGEVGQINTVIGGYAKPVLYLYPEKDTNVTVSFEKPELLTTTYPKFNKTWNVLAKSNGDLFDSKGKYYYGLYWEEQGSTEVDFKTGFYVEKKKAIDFLEEKLTKIGLNSRERNEFIMYWLPILEKNEKNLVYFELTKKRQNFNRLIINPTPDSLLRVAIHVKKVDKKTSIKEEKLPTFERTGFTAVEWGGVVH